MRIEYGYIALKPIKAEHPIGSGTVVEYLPGDPVPAADWGRAEDSLVERGKIARYMINVEEVGDLPVVEDESEEDEPVEEEAALHVTPPAKKKAAKTKKRRKA